MQVIKYFLQPLIGCIFKLIDFVVVLLITYVMRRRAVGLGSDAENIHLQ